MPHERKEIASEVEAIIRKTLQRDLPEITEETTLFGDLGVGSLDLLEIIYEIEEVFDIEVAPDHIIPRKLLRDPEYVQDGCLTSKGYARLKEQYSFTKLPVLPPSMPVVEVAKRILTFGGVIDYFQSLIDAEDG